MKKLRQLLIFVSATVMLFILSGQSTGPSKTDQSLPPVLLKQLDSLRHADDLEGWLYAYRSYVYDDPAKRIPVLTGAQAHAWRSCKTDAERMEWINGLAAQGYYLLYNGNILGSIDAYEKAYGFYMEKNVPGFDLIEYVLKPLGNNYTRLGDYGRAMYVQEKTLEMARLSDTPQIASICHNLAVTSSWKEDPTLAKQYCETGLQHVKNRSALQGLLLSTLAGVELKMGAIGNAERDARDAIGILRPFLADKEEPNAPYWLHGAMKESGNIAKEKKDFAGALGFYKKAADLINNYYKGERTRERAQLAVLSGQVLQQSGQPREALDEFNKALSLLFPSVKMETADALPGADKLYGESAILDALNGKAACLDKLGQKKEALAGYRLMYAAERKLRREFFSSTAQEQHRRENKLWEEASINTAYELWKQEGKKEYAETAFLFAEMSKAQLLLDEMQNNFRYSGIKNNDSLLLHQEQLMQAIALYERDAALSANDQSDSSLTASIKDLQYELSLVQKKLREKFPAQDKMGMGDDLASADSLLTDIPEGTSLVEFFCGETRAYAFQAERGRIVEFIQLDSAEKLMRDAGAFVKTWFQQGPANMINKPREYAREAYTLYRVLFGRMHIDPLRPCNLVPDGILGYLPFEALLTDTVYSDDIGQWPFLLKKADLHQSYSLMTAIRQKRSVYPQTSFAGFFVSFDSSTRSAIPAVKKESEAIQKIVKGKFYKEEEATLSNFKEQLGEANLLHISTHSFLQGKENMPVLQLADDKFFLFELYGNRFHPQLVVLSACRTGHGMLAKGEGIISLARGFTATGAGGIIAGLWDMNDEVTALLMAMFYRELTSKGDPAEALHHAKLEWLQQGNLSPVQKLPYYWAGMVYSGGNGKISLEQDHRWFPPNWLLAVLTLLVSATGIFFLVKKRRSA